MKYFAKFARSSCISCAALAWMLLLGAGNLSCNEDDGDGGPSVPGAYGRNNPIGLGNRIDRAGRVAITAALVGTFDLTGDDQSTIRDSYNKLGIGQANFLPSIQTNLAILDGIDGECGNQLIADLNEEVRYGALATTLLDDRLYLDRGESGSVYLGVEAEAVGAIPAGAASGGGRQPGFDAIKTSYSVLVNGSLDDYDDGIEEDDSNIDPTTFPFLAPP